jgi:hypothetical protein
MKQPLLEAKINNSERLGSNLTWTMVVSSVFPKTKIWVYAVLFWTIFSKMRTGISVSKVTGYGLNDGFNSYLRQAKFIFTLYKWVKFKSDHYSFFWHL